MAFHTIFQGSAQRVRTIVIHTHESAKNKDYIRPGAHEPPKEHETQCHHNPHYITLFEINWIRHYIIGINSFENNQVALHTRKILIIRNVIVCLPILERNTLHCRHVPLFHYVQFRIWLPITRFQFPYKSTNNLDCNGTWQVA